MFKPMLASQEDPLGYPNYFQELRYPYLVSPKYDGIRCIVKEGRCKSRKFLDLPSAQVQELFSRYEHLDGELIVGGIDEETYNRTQSHVMSKNKPANFITLNVFDFTSDSHRCLTSVRRLEVLSDLVRAQSDPLLKFVPQIWVENEKELLIEEEKWLTRGFEGVMLRNPFEAYKCGRATWRQNIINKLKRFEDLEGVVVGFIEANENLNEDVRDNLGHAKRSKRQEGLIGANTLGKFIVHCELYPGIDLEIPPGSFDHKERQLIWDNQESYLSRTVVFRHFPHGQKDLPRQPRAKGWRTQNDM
jgi:DNA ligase 1